MHRQIFFLLILLPVLCKSQDKGLKTNFNGFVDSYHAMRVESPNDFLSSRSRFRGELKKRHNKSKLYLSFNINHNAIVEDYSGFELREAYLDYTGTNWGLSAGRQIIIWGAADGVRITDLVSPMDYSEFLARDYDDLRIPINSLKLSVFKNNIKFEFVYVPLFSGFNVPLDKNNPWSMKFPVPSSKDFLLIKNEPEKKVANGELGGRLKFNLPGVDFSIAGLYSWNKMPIMKTSIRQDTFLLSLEHRRMSFLGGDISKPLGNFVLRGEAAFNFNKHFSFLGLKNALAKRNTVNYLMGVDWYPAGNWTFMFQYSNEYILDYQEDIKNDKNTSLLTFNVSKKIVNNTFVISDFTYYDLNNDSFFSRFSFDYLLSDQIHVLAGYDWFNGDKGMFGFYKDNTEVWMKVKYSF